jgi:hypothetical protein
VPVARLAREIREIQARDLFRAENDKVVADTLHLGEPHGEDDSRPGVPEDQPARWYK